jgi:Mg-chelatase subunit ChlD
MKHIILIFQLLFISNSSFSQDNCLNMDIMIVADYSGSMQEEKSYVIDGILAISERFANNDQVRVGVKLFSDDCYDMQPLTFDKLSFSDSMSWQGGGSTMMAIPLLRSMNDLIGDRPDAHKVILILSDGDPTDRYETEDASLFIKQSGILIAVVHIETSSLYAMPSLGVPFLNSIASEGFTARTTYDRLAKTLIDFGICL